VGGTAIAIVLARSSQPDCVRGEFGSVAAGCAAAVSPLDLTRVARRRSPPHAQRWRGRRVPRCCWRWSWPSRRAAPRRRPRRNRPCGGAASFGPRPRPPPRPTPPPPAPAPRTAGARRSAATPCGTRPPGGCRSSARRRRAAAAAAWRRSTSRPAPARRRRPTTATGAATPAALGSCASPPTRPTVGGRQGPGRAGALRCAEGTL
jgi:hypothetical protein